ncbi:hypothetical protein FPG59_01165 [Flavobacterium sp. FPG59]|nr:hypothetical protein FPG59_01165 [Flavobacterium sp. FPG59]
MFSFQFSVFGSQFTVYSIQFTLSFQLPLVLTNGNLSFRAFGFSQIVPFVADLKLFIKTKENNELYR